MRITYNTALVLSAIDAGTRHGFDIMDKTQLPSGTVYPILRRCESRALVRSRWEEESTAHAAGRPRRRLYELSGSGQRALETARQRFAKQSRIFSDTRARGNT